MKKLFLLLIFLPVLSYSQDTDSLRNEFINLELKQNDLQERISSSAFLLMQSEDLTTLSVSMLVLTSAAGLFMFSEGYDPLVLNATIGVGLSASLVTYIIAKSKRRRAYYQLKL